MPETAVDKNHALQAGEHQIGTAREVASVKPKPIAHPEHEPANRQLRRCVNRTNTRHAEAALLWAERIGHADEHLT